MPTNLTSCRQNNDDRQSQILSKDNDNDDDDYRKLDWSIIDLRLGHAGSAVTVVKRRAQLQQLPQFPATFSSRLSVETFRRTTQNYSAILRTVPSIDHTVGRNDN
jgi:hypothetical protein